MATARDVGARAPAFTLPGTQGCVALSQRLRSRSLVRIGRDGRVLWRRSDPPIFRRSADERKAKLAEPGLGA